MGFAKHILCDGARIYSFGLRVQPNCGHPARLLISHCSCALRSHALANMLNLSTLPSVYFFYRSSVWVVNIAVLQSPVRVKHDWPQRLRACKCNTRFALRRSASQPYMYVTKNRMIYLDMLPAEAIANSARLWFVHNAGTITPKLILKATKHRKTQQH